MQTSADNSLKYFSYFAQKTGFAISCKLSPLETICMKCQNQFSVMNKKNIITLLSAQLAQRLVKVKENKEQNGDPNVLDIFLENMQSNQQDMFRRSICCYLFLHKSIPFVHSLETCLLDMSFEWPYDMFFFWRMKSFPRSIITCSSLTSQVCTSTPELSIPYYYNNNINFYSS